MIPHSPSTLIGVPYDRPVIGYGGKTVNTLRLWSATAAHSFDFQRFSGGDFVASIAEALERGIADARSLSGRPYAAGARAAPDAGIFPRRLFARRRRSQVSRVEYGLADAAREGRHPAQRHASEPRRAGTHAHSARRSASGLGRGVGPHAADARLHQPHPASRGAGALAGRVDGDPHSAPARDHLRDQPPAARRHSRPLPRRRRARGSDEPGRGRADEAHPHGEPGDRRLPQHQRRGRDPFRTLAQDDGARPRRGVSRTLQQQDQRGHAEALASPRQSLPRRDDFSRHRRLLDRRSDAIAKASAARGRRCVPGGYSQSQARGQGPVRRLGQAAYGRRPSIRTRSSIARSSAFTNTSASCSTR